ncbi:MAG: extracellular solute-binding protein [Oscillibacter sp.]|nr:extracellular solute-binding protein [Oscillibacter sp.]
MKRPFAMMLALCMCLSLIVSGCGGEKPSADSQDASSAITKVLVDKEEVNISFWTGTGAANFPYLEAIVNAFQEEYPNIHVDFQNQGPVTDLMDKLTQNIVSKSTPTLSNINPTYFKEYIDSGAIIDLAPYYEDAQVGFTAEERAAFLQNFIAEAQSFGGEGTMYGFPTNKKTTEVLFYNKTYFDSKGWDAPATWDEVAAYSRQIREDTGVPGFSYDVAYGEGAFHLLSMQWGSPYIDDEGAVSIDNDASREALRFYKENYDAGYFTMPSDLPSSNGGNYSSNGFANKECYMYVGSAAGAQYTIPDPEKGQELFEVGIAPLPQKDASHKVVFTRGEDYCIFSNASEEERVAAWLLIKFLSRDDQNAEWLIATGNLPITSTMENNAEYKVFLDTPNDGSKTYYTALEIRAAMDMADYMTYEAMTDVTASLAAAAGSMWKAVIIGGQNIDSAIADAVAQVK